MSDARAVGASRVPSIVPLLNPVIRRLVGAGLPFGPNVLLTVRGRTSGLPRTVPVAILEHGGRRYVQSPFGEVHWVRNLRVAGEATIASGRTREVVDAVEVPPEVAAPILRDALAPFRASRIGSALVSWLFRLPPDSTPEEVLEEARRHPMFELTRRPAGDPALSQVPRRDA